MGPNLAQLNRLAAKTMVGARGAKSCRQMGAQLVVVCGTAGGWQAMILQPGNGRPVIEAIEGGRLL